MKRKALSFILVLCMCFSSVSFFAFAVEEPYVGYFQVWLTEDSSWNIESTMKNFKHGAIERIEVISEENNTGRPQQGMIIIYVKSGEDVSSLYEYLYSHSAVYLVLPDYSEIRENVRVENLLQEKSYVRPYDVNADGKVGADDARLVLRASVGLEKLPSYALRAATFGAEHEITAFTARWILRASVGLENIPIFEIDVVNFGEQFIIGPIECQGAAGFNLRVSGDTDKFIIEEKYFGADTLSIGGSVRCYFLCTPKEKGSFTLKFTYEDIKSATPEVVDEFSVDINHVIRIISEPNHILEKWFK